MIAVGARNVSVKRIHCAVFSCVCRHMVTFFGPAVGCALRDFAGSEERERGGRAALFELAKASEFAALPRRRDERPARA